MPTAASAPASTAITIHTIPPDGTAATMVSTHTTSAAMSAANLTTAVLPGGGHVQTRPDRARPHADVGSPDATIRR